MLSLTDGRLGENNYITQSLLILVEDANDNAPVFEQSQLSVSVKENVDQQDLAKLVATDRDSGPFGQVLRELFKSID